MSVADNIKRLREEHGLTQKELGDIAGVSDKAVSTWELGIKAPRHGAVAKLATHFGIPQSEIWDGPLHPFGGRLERIMNAWGVTPDILSHEVPIMRARLQALRLGKSAPTDEELDLLAGFFRMPRANLLGDGTPIVPHAVIPIGELLGLQHKRIPVLGRVPAGIPVEAVSDVIGEIDYDIPSGAKPGEFFALRVVGNSMFPEYLDGDTVVVHVQSTAKSGDDVIAYVGNDDATFKRLYFAPDGLELRPINKSYPSLEFSAREVEHLPVSIAGVVVELRRKR